MKQAAREKLMKELAVIIKLVHREEIRIGARQAEQSLSGGGHQG